VLSGLFDNIPRKHAKFFQKMTLAGKAGSYDRFSPILIDPLRILPINRMRWSGKTGEGWSKRALCPLSD
jgi:hypothetical protein